MMPQSYALFGRQPSMATENRATRPFFPSQAIALSEKSRNFAAKGQGGLTS
jgi:hypothetical protein